MNLMMPKHNQNDSGGSVPGPIKKTSVQGGKKHVTPENLSEKLKLHRKTELSEFFQATKSKYCDIFK